MKILIPGGAGFLGSNLAASLLAEGHEVVVVDNLLTGSRDNITRLEKMPHFSFFEMGVETDLFLKTFLESNIHHFDYVYNLACPTGVPNIQILGEEMIDACSTGTKNVLKVALKNKAKFLLTSSSEVYGDPEIFPQHEDYTGNVPTQGWRSSYEEGKRFAEALVALYVRKYGLDAKTVRLFNVYGPNMNLIDQRVIPRFVCQALSNEPITLHDNVALRTMCYVSDIVRGLEMVIEHGKPGDIFNLGGDEELSMKDLAEKVIAAVKSKSTISLVPGVTHDHKRRMPDLTKIRTLGWNYSVSLEEGLEKTIQNFKERLSSRSFSPSRRKVA
jgi:nucleoside-diphosphate-sugar epimerase